MKTIYIRRLDGTIKELPADRLLAPPAFYKSGMCKVVTNTKTYIVSSCNVEILADEEDEVINYAY